MHLRYQNQDNAHVYSLVRLTVRAHKVWKQTLINVLVENYLLLWPSSTEGPRGGGGGNDTPWLWVPAARIFKELSCLGVKFSNIHPAPESDFLSGTFLGGIYCYANFFCYANFSIVFKRIFLGGGANSRGKSLEGKVSSKRNNVSKYRNQLFSMETLTNSCTVCHIRTLNMLKTSKLGLISWTKDK